MSEWTAGVLTYLGDSIARMPDQATGALMGAVAALAFVWATFPRKRGGR